MYLHHSSIWASIEWDIVHLSNEDGGHGDKECGTIHVDCCSYGENKLGYSRINMVLLHTPEGDGQGSSSGNKELRESYEDPWHAGSKISCMSGIRLNRVWKKLEKDFWCLWILQLTLKPWQKPSSMLEKVPTRTWMGSFAQKQSIWPERKVFKPEINNLFNL